MIGMVTMTRIAQVTQVSLTTASHVLNRTRPVSDAARAAVLQAAEELGYEETRLAACTREVTVGAGHPRRGESVLRRINRSAEAVRVDVDLLIMTCGEDPDLEYGL